jgi:Ca-activated chloride channel family protein
MRAGKLVLGLLLMAAVSPGAALGQGWVEGGNIVRERTSVSVQVRNQVATVEVEEWFRNRGGAAMGEADYLYPLPPGAVFSSYSLFQGDQELRGEMLDAGEAREIYERIVRSRKDPALIELVGHGLVRARVFPIAAGESRRIIMRYTQPLTRAGDALEFRYPGNRNTPTAPVTFTLTAENGAQFRDAVSPTHDVTVRRDRGRMVVRPVVNGRTDLALLLPFAERDVGIVVSTHRAATSEDGYFMLRLSPGEVEAASRVARDVTIVMDVSGSMSGEKMEQAKGAMRQLLGTLGQADRFRMISFSSSSSLWREGWTPATPTELRNATRWVDQLRANGGTNIADALADAFRMSSQAGRLNVVVFVTDGLPSVGEQEPERLALIAERSTGARVFAFGVGHDVNTQLLDRLGAAGRGSAQYVQPGESVEDAIGGLASRIQYPVLTDLTLKATGVTLREIQPVRLPDLFSGEDLVVFGRYRATSTRNAAGTIEITGRRNGRVERYSTRVQFPSHSGSNDYIPQLWAARKLGELTRQVRLNGRNPELVEEIRATALRYGLLSEYTSYFVTEPGMAPPIVAQGNAGGLPTNALAQLDVRTGGISASSGAGAVAASDAARVRRETNSVAQLQSAEKAAEARMAPAAPPPATPGEAAVRAGTQRIVAGRAFVERAGVWEDAASGKQKVLGVAVYSEAYFALLRALPELRQYVTELPHVAVAGKAVTIRFTATGATSLTAAQVARAITEFRGPQKTP